MITLLSPAKTLDFESQIRLDNTSDHIFPKETMQLVRILKKLKKVELQSLMNLSDNLAALNVMRFKTFKKEYTEDVSKAAIEAFKGDVYLGLDAPTLLESDIAFAQKHIRILSGLYGVLKPLDKIQAYRLEMGTRLENKSGSNLYHFWGDKLSKALNKELKNQESETILNLASNEYFKAIDKKSIKANITNANFKEYRDGQLKFISFNAKKARGLMARYIIKNRIDSISDLKGFDVEGYYYSEEHSDVSNLLFVK